MAAELKEDPSARELKEEVNCELFELDEIVKHENLQEDLEQNYYRDLNVKTTNSHSGSNTSVEKQIHNNVAEEEHFDEDFVSGA